MKNFLVIIFFAILSTSCYSQGNEISKVEQLKAKNINVEDFISHLRTNSYDYHSLPAFSLNDISTLFKYVNDTTLTNTIPVNPISSHFQHKCEIGIIALWTIENIRLNYPYSDNMISNYPSQNPIIVDISNDIPKTIYNQETLSDIRSLYLEWWKNNSSKEPSELRDLNPLKGTNYRWK